MVFAAALDARKVCVVQDYYPYHYWYNMSSMTGQYDGKYLGKDVYKRQVLKSLKAEDFSATADVKKDLLYDNMVKIGVSYVGSLPSSSIQKIDVYKRQSLSSSLMRSIPFG